MGAFKHPDISWEDHTARQAQSRRFLQSIDDNFLMQVVEQPTRKGALLDLVLINKEGLVEDVKVGGRLGCRDHEMVEFRILHGGSDVWRATSTHGPPCLREPWPMGFLPVAPWRGQSQPSWGPGFWSCLSPCFLHAGSHIWLLMLPPRWKLNKEAINQTNSFTCLFCLEESLKERRLCRRLEWVTALPARLNKAGIPGSVEYLLVKVDYKCKCKYKYKYRYRYRYSINVNMTIGKNIWTYIDHMNININIIQIQTCTRRRSRSQFIYLTYNNTWSLTLPISEMFG